MIVRTDSVTFTGNNWADRIYDYLSQSITGLTHTSGDTTVNFFNAFTIKTQATNYPGLIVECDGVDKQFAEPGMSAGGTYTMTLVASDDFLVLRAYRTAGVTSTTNGFCFSYIKDAEGKYYVGGTGGAPISNYYSIENYTYFDVTNSATPSFVVPKMINFKAEVGKIAYSDLAPVSDGIYHSFYAKGLYSCSTVNLSDTISLANGKNLFAVGTNTAIEITT